MLSYHDEDWEESLTFGNVNTDEAIMAHCEREEIERYAVYWLECHLPEFEPRDQDAYEETVSELSRLIESEQNQSWIHSTLRSSSAHYVGYTSSLEPRIKAHVDGLGSEFCKLFPPKKLRGVWWFSSKKKARLAEQTKAAEVRDHVDNGYVFQF